MSSNSPHETSLIRWCCSPSEMESQVRLIKEPEAFLHNEAAPSQLGLSGAANWRVLSGKPDPSCLRSYPGKSISHLEWEGAGSCQDALPQGAFAGSFMDSRAWEDRGHWVKGMSFLGGNPRQSKFEPRCLVCSSLMCSEVSWEKAPEAPCSLRPLFIPICHCSSPLLPSTF